MSSTDSAITTSSPGTDQTDRAAESRITPSSRVVTIYVDNAPYRISYGKHTVAELRRLASVPECDEFVQVVSGVPAMPLGNEVVLLIEGEERFLLEEPSPGPEESFVRREWEERVMSAMRETLSPLEQTALWLKAYEGMPVRDITRLLDLKEESGARALLQTARRKLKAALERDAAGEEGT